MSEHRVTITFEKGDPWPTLRFHCDAAHDAPCRRVCAESECEEGCVDTESHDADIVDYCNVVEWLDNTDDVAGAIFGDETEIAAAIDFDWGPDYVDWRFADV